MKKGLILLFALCLNTAVIYAQTDDDPVLDDMESMTDAMEVAGGSVNLDELAVRSSGGELVQNKADKMPTYPGGQPALSRFLRDNLVYPQSAQDNGIQGRVDVKFIVKKSGEISEPEVVKTLQPDCDSEALRVVKIMPKWKAGKHKGKKVGVYHTLSIIFAPKK